MPTRLKLLNWGGNPSKAGDVKVSPRTVSSLPAFHAEKRWDRIALDYEHNTLEGTPAHKASSEPRAVAAFGVPMVVAGDGVYLDDLQWTPHGTKFAREYCDLSPAPVLAPDGTVLALHSVALCRHGAVDGLHFFSADIGNPKKGVGMNEWLRKYLGLGEDATEEQCQAAFVGKVSALCAEAVSAAVKPMGESLEALQTKIEPLTAEGAQGGGGESAESPHIKTLEASVTALSAQVVAIQGDLVQRERSDIVTDACRQGKVIPLSAEQVSGMEPAVLRDMVAKLPVTVPVDRRTPVNVKPLSADSAVPSDSLTEVARRCGLDPKKVLEVNAQN